MLNDRIVVRTLSMQRLLSRHTGVELKNHLLSTLTKFGIETKQIFAITTDNGSNMLKAISLMNEQQSIESMQRADDVLQPTDSHSSTITDEDASHTESAAVISAVDSEKFTNEMQSTA